MSPQPDLVCRDRDGHAIYASTWEAQAALDRVLRWLRRTELLCGAVIAFTAAALTAFWVLGVIAQS